jgi:hypothetical protein
VDGLFVDGGGFEGVFIRELKGVVDQLLVGIFVFSYLLVTHIHFAAEGGKLQVDPPGIFRFFSKKEGIFYHVGIYGILKSVRIARLVEHTVFSFREFDLEITPGLRCESLLTTSQEYQQQGAAGYQAQYFIHR